MTTTTEIEPKTIVISYNDLAAIFNNCRDSDGTIHKDFYDWYFDKEGKYFSLTGMLILEEMDFCDSKIALSFNLTNPDEAIFSLYIYSTQALICTFSFKREDNLTLSSNTLVYNILKTSEKNMEVSVMSVNSSFAKRIRSIRKAKGTLKGGMRKENAKDFADRKLKAMFIQFNEALCRTAIQAVYSILYYTYIQKPEEITSSSSFTLLDTVRVKALYKYTGYINLSDYKIYKPSVKRDPNIESREYQRHIEKWSVRGHYRRLKNGEKIWIEPHTRGEGELEKRIYGIENEKDLNLIPKVFKIEKSISNESYISNTKVTEPKENNVKSSKFLKLPKQIWTWLINKLH